MKRKSKILLGMLLGLAFLGIIVGICLVAICGWLSYELAAGLIGCLGGVVGGALTLLGVRWTIQDSSRKRDEELALQYRPLLSARVEENCRASESLPFELITLYHNSSFDDTDLFYGLERIKLKNVGRGEIVSLRVAISSCEPIGVPASRINFALTADAYILFNNKLRLIPVDDSVDIVIGTPSPATLHKAQEFDGLWLRLRYVIDIEMRGPFSSDAQYYSLEFFIDERFCAGHRIRTIDSVMMHHIDNNDGEQAKD